MAQTFPCFKCNGFGHIGAYNHIAGGVCFQCKGEGRLAYRPRQAFVEPHPELLVPEHLRATPAQWDQIEALCMTTYGLSEDAFCVLVEKRAGGQACLKYMTAEMARKAIEIGSGPEWQSHMRKSPISMLPLASHATGTTFIPAITALAGFVPCAETGMRHTRRPSSPRAR